MNLMTISCPECGSENLGVHMNYTILSGEIRELYQCKACKTYFSETKNRAIARLRTPLSKISQVLNALNEGLGINAATRVFKVAKNSIYTWLDRLAGVKKTLLLYALCHQFVQQTIEGDEVYTRVNKNKPPTESEGWTIILMERASRFIWELECDEKTESLFTNAMQTLAQVIEQTGDLALFTDGERRYGNLLFSICSELLRTGKRGRPASILPEGVHVRVKNKGQQKQGPKRPKYQTPWREHPRTDQLFDDSEIHANHLEAFNSSIRRQPALQRRLDTLWLFHNFVNPHFSTRLVPAVALGILQHGFSWAQLFRIQYVKST